MNYEEEFDKAIDKLESGTDVDASDFDLREFDGPMYAREYLGRWIDEYASPPSAPHVFLDGYMSWNAGVPDVPINMSDWRNYDYLYHRNMHGYDRIPEEASVYNVRPVVLNISRDWDTWNMLDHNFCYYRPSTVRFEILCPACHGRNEITVTEDIILRNPNPRLTCMCGAVLIIDGRW